MQERMARLLVLLLLAALLQLYGASTHLKTPRRTNMTQKGNKMAEKIARQSHESRLPRRTNSWAVEITHGGEEMAEKIARQNGFVNLGPVSSGFLKILAS